MRSEISFILEHLHLFGSNHPKPCSIGIERKRTGFGMSEDQVYLEVDISGLAEHGHEMK